MVQDSITHFDILKSQEENVLEKNLVWIFGANRSGTSWLARQLFSHPQICGIDEPLIGQHLGIYSFANHEVTRFFDIHYKRKGYFFSNEYSDTWKIYLRKLILNRIYEQWNDLSKKVVIKEPNGSLGADIISNCLPNSKLIIMLRDGRDIIDSRLDAVTEGGWSTKLGWKPIPTEGRLPFIERESKRWVAIISNLLKTYENHDESFKILIHYEDLLKNTFQKLKNIFSFLEISFSDKEIEKLANTWSYKKVSSNSKGKGKMIRLASPGNWKQGLEENERDVVNKIMSPTLTELGYI